MRQQQNTCFFQLFSIVQTIRKFTFNVTKSTFSTNLTLFWNFRPRILAAPSTVCKINNNNLFCQHSFNITMSSRSLNLKSLASNRKSRSAKTVENLDLTSDKSAFFGDNEDVEECKQTEPPPTRKKREPANKKTNKNNVSDDVNKEEEEKNKNKEEKKTKSKNVTEEKDAKKAEPKKKSRVAKTTKTKTPKTSESESDLNLSSEKSEFFETKLSDKEETKAKKKRTPVKIKSDDEENSAMENGEPAEKKDKWQPENWEQTLNNIREMRKHKTAPVDEMGCHKCADPNATEADNRFQSLVALMLSSQTKDQVTHAAMTNLIEHGCTAEIMSNIDDKELEKLIYPVGFYKRKVTYIKRTAEILKRQYNGDIPRTLKELCDLPGVGPKMAHICMQVAWNEVSGIGVDTHVHRISNRLRWVKKETKNPEDTRKGLEDWLPLELWGEVNHLLVGFGQEICTPLRPKCDECINSDICPYAKSTKKGVK